MKPEELADLIERLRQAGKNFPTLRMLTDDAEEALRRVEKLEAALQMLIDTRPDDDGSEYHCGYSDAMIDAAGIARQALTGEA